MATTRPLTHTFVSQMIFEGNNPEAYKQLRALRTTKDQQAVLSLPSELNRECAKTGPTPVVCGSNYDIWKGIWLEVFPVALKLCRDFRIGVRNQKAMEVSDDQCGVTSG